MKKEIKKYPLLICLIVSIAIIVASLFVIGFKGLKFDTTLVGGSQIEVVLPDDADTQVYSNSARVVCKQTGISLYHTTIQEKYTAGSENGEYFKRVMVLTFAEKDLSVEKQTEYREALAEKLDLDIDMISDFEIVTNSIDSNSVWYLLLSIGVIISCLFIFAWIRYDIFAGITFFIAYLHNIILYFALSGICRLPIGLASLATMTILTFIMSGVLINVFEQYRKASRLHIDDKQTISQKLIYAEKESLLPYSFIAAALAIISIVLQLSPVFMVRLMALGILVSLLICIYTTVFVAPGVYSYILEMAASAQKSKLSRNDTKNKVIKKKIAKSTKIAKKNIEK